MPPFLIYPLLFRTLGGSHVYDPVTNKVVEVSAQLFDALARELMVAESELGRVWAHPALSEDCRSELNRARESGDLVAQEIILESSPSLKEVNEWENRPWRAPGHLIFEITDACNLRCQYCALSGDVGYHHQRGNHSWETNALESAIQWYLKNSNPEKERTISFYGGEPLLYSSLLLRVADYANSICTGPAGLRFQLTTNGTLLTLELAKSLIRQNFTLGVSLDGTAETHDWSRKDAEGKGTFGRIIANLKRIWDYYEGDLHGKVFLCPTLDGSSRGSDLLGWVKLLEEEPFLRSTPKKFNSVSSQTPAAYRPRAAGDDQAAMLQFYELYKADVLQGHKDELGLFTYVIDPDMKKIHGRAMGRIPYFQMIGGMCVPGSIRALASLDGNLYPCEKVDARFSIGKIDRGIEPELVRKLSEHWARTVLDQCRGCWAVRFCSPCAAMMSGTDDVKRQFQTFCSSTRYKWAVSIALYHRMMELQPGCWSVLPAEKTTS
jgi:uncharacterized protein